MSTPQPGSRPDPSDEHVDAKVVPETETEAETETEPNAEPNAESEADGGTDGDGDDPATAQGDATAQEDGDASQGREAGDVSVDLPSQDGVGAGPDEGRGEDEPGGPPAGTSGDTASRDAAPEPVAPAPSAAGEPSGWRRLGAALRPRATRSQVLAGILCAALGFALVVQVQQSASDQLSSARQEDLVRLLDEVTDRSEQLDDEVAGLESTRDDLVSGSGQAQSALELAEQRAEQEGILSGRLPAQGPGVQVTIEDPGGVLEAAQLFNVLEELRNAGAEVVELNGVRLVTSTWFRDEESGIVVDETPLTAPYEWTVIGDPETLDRALEIPGGAFATVRTAGAEATTTRRDQVQITAVTPPEEPQHAKPEQPRG